MAKYKIAWLPGDGIGVDVLEAARVVLDKLQLNAEYVAGDMCGLSWLLASTQSKARKPTPDEAESRRR
ncbi:MAG: hypothetical protein ACLQU3_03005 [Limisphaerales bacterium]